VVHVIFKFRGTLLALRLAAVARAADVAGRWPSLLPPRSCPVVLRLDSLRRLPRPPDEPSRCSVRRSPDTVPRDHVDANLPDLRSTSKLYRTPWSDLTFSPGFPSVRPGQLTGGTPFAPPPTPRDASTPAQRATPRFGPGEPSPKSRSVLVVSHHLDGFLRIAIRGPVASRCRSWGSRGFRRRVADRRSGARRLSLRAGLTPLEGTPG
jgi:hypothetical protein